MKLLILFSIIFITQLNMGCASLITTDDTGKSFGQSMISSYILLDIKTLNEKLANEENINISPLEVIFKLLNINSEQKDLAIYQSFPSIEEKSTVIVTVVREGYPDDSVRGIWNEFQLKNNSKSSWKIITAKQAFLCWRSGSNRYQKAPCP